MKTYEGMFLLDAGNHDFDVAAEPVREVLARIQAEVLSIKPWDERRLSYPIKGRKRGLYVLTYFKADPANMADLQHEIQLNEKVLRALLLSADHLSEEKIQAETPATLSQVRRAAADAQKASKAKVKADESAKAAPDPQEPSSQDKLVKTPAEDIPPAKPKSPAEEKTGEAKTAPDKDSSKSDDPK